MNTELILQLIVLLNNTTNELEDGTYLDDEERQARIDEMRVMKRQLGQAYNRQRRTRKIDQPQLDALRETVDASPRPGNIVQIPVYYRTLGILLDAYTEKHR